MKAKICSYYTKHIEDEPAKIADPCKERQGIWQPEEVPDNFYMSDKRWYRSACKHCLNKKERNGGYDPVITKDWPRDENGRLLSYWHIIDKDIIIRGE